MISHWSTLLSVSGVQRYSRRRPNGSYCDVSDIARGDINIEAFCKTCEVSTFKNASCIVPCVLNINFNGGVLLCNSISFYVRCCVVRIIARSHQAFALT